jgi:hypothetical protein
MQLLYIRPTQSVVGPIPRPCANESHVHWAAVNAVALRHVYDTFVGESNGMSMRAITKTCCISIYLVLMH